MRQKHDPTENGRRCYFSTFQLALKNDGLFCPFGEGRGSKGVADNDPTKVKSDNIFAALVRETDACQCQLMVARQGLVVARQCLDSGKTMLDTSKEMLDTIKAMLCSIRVIAIKARLKQSWLHSNR